MFVTTYPKIKSSSPLECAQKQNVRSVVRATLQNFQGKNDSKPMTKVQSYRMSPTRETIFLRNPLCLGIYCTE